MQNERKSSHPTAHAAAESFGWAELAAELRAWFWIWGCVFFPTPPEAILVGTGMPENHVIRSFYCDPYDTDPRNG